MGRIEFAAIFDTTRSGGPSTLASWAVRPRPTGLAFEAYLQRLIMRLVWRGDQTAGRSDQVVDPNEVAAMEALEVASAVSPVDFESAPFRPYGAARESPGSSCRGVVWECVARPCQPVSASRGRDTHCAGWFARHCVRWVRRRTALQSTAPSGVRRQNRSSRVETSRRSPSPAAREERSRRRSSWWSLGQSCVSQLNPTQHRRGDHRGG